MNWFPCFSIEDFSEVMSLKIILQILKERQGGKINNNNNNNSSNGTVLTLSMKDLDCTVI